MHERTTAQMHNCTNAQMHERTNAQMRVLNLRVSDFPWPHKTTTTLLIPQGQITLVQPSNTDSNVNANANSNTNANANSNAATLCLDVTGMSTKSGTPLHVWPCVPGAVAPPQQRWEWQVDGSVKSNLSGLCLDARDPNGDGPGAGKTCDALPYNTTKYCDKSLSASERAMAGSLVCLFVGWLVGNGVQAFGILKIFGI